MNAIRFPSAEKRGSWIQPAVSKSTFPIGYSSRSFPETRWTTASSDPPGTQSAPVTSCRTSFGTPPESGTLATVPRACVNRLDLGSTRIAISPAEEMPATRRRNGQRRGLGNAGPQGVDPRTRAIPRGAVVGGLAVGPETSGKDGAPLERQALEGRLRRRRQFGGRGRVHRWPQGECRRSESESPGTGGAPARRRRSLRTPWT